MHFFLSFFAKLWDRRGKKTVGAIHRTHEYGHNSSKERETERETRTTIVQNGPGRGSHYRQKAPKTRRPKLYKRHECASSTQSQPTPLSHPFLLPALYKRPLFLVEGIGGRGGIDGVASCGFPHVQSRWTASATAATVWIPARC